MANRRGKVETVIDFTFWGSQITTDGDCIHGVQRCLLLGRQTMTNLDCVLKSRDIPLSWKVCKVKDMVFPVVVYRCENQARKKSECWRIYAFKLWWLEKTVQSPLDCKIKPVNPKGNQPWRFTGRTDAEALKLWPICKELTLIRKDWEGLKAKGEGGNRMKWLDSITDSVNMNLSKLGDCGGQRSLACYSLRGCKEWDTT